MSIDLQPPSFTLDTNCLIDLAEDRPAAVHIHALLAAAREGKAGLALVASSASERQLSGTFLQNVAAFNERRDGLGLGDLPLLPSIAKWNVSFFGHGLYGWAEGSAREQVIYSTLFPTSPYGWADYAASKGVDVSDNGSPPYNRWRNQMLDAQALWAHAHAGRDVFVTSDMRLSTLNGHPDFPTMAIRTPEEAASLL
ncbi:hypothetical protein I0J99_01300 [Sinorhizobium meliloti]|uniref:hypothetical protein n=1 Tax=Rhizobium meliloti TaxID=382 RepID=UPI000D1F4FEF|nr:hypothetical protein [Sinorhizobium meliloti]QPI25900.1 hypothetical protein I0J99_01300 [Sinorhizobium meliloti]RMI11893.1 hypothetical protein DA101_011650 [Sinorhizobium meliloti]WQP01191.1 hypothetical protein U8C41_16270 [Sinorhizobium meliloti]